MFFDRGEMLDTLGDMPAAERDGAGGAAARARDRCCSRTPGASMDRPAGPTPARSGCACRCWQGALARAARRSACPSCSPARTSRAARTRRLIERGPRGDAARSADLVLDAGELAGTPSTVIDLRAYAREGTLAGAAGGSARAAASAQPGACGAGAMMSVPRALLASSPAAATGALGWNRPPGSGQPDPPRAWAPSSSSPGKESARERAKPRLLQPPAGRGGPGDRGGAARRARARAEHAPN